MGSFLSIFCSFCQKRLFLKHPAKYNCSGLPAFKCQRYTVDWPSNQKLFHCYQHAKIIQSISQFSKSFMRYTWFKSPMIYNASPIFDYAHPIIVTVTFSFPKFVSTCKKSAHFLNSLLRNSRF